MLADLFESFPDRDGFFYARYWLPALIGIATGFVIIGVGKVAARIAANRRKARDDAPVSLAPPGPPEKQEEYDPFVYGSAGERRKSFRRTGNPVEIEYAIGEDTNNARQGWVFDRSKDGLGLKLSEPFEVGTVLLVHPVRGGEIAPWVEVVVRGCRPAKGQGFEVGCQFSKTPGYAVLLLFG